MLEVGMIRASTTPNICVQRVLKGYLLITCIRGIFAYNVSLRDFVRNRIAQNRKKLAW